jgi:predicted RNA binding protein YcfA (HicA-like mRNA interferase family)
MPKLPRINSRQICSALEKMGFVIARQSGSHIIYINSEGKRTTVPFHGNKILHPKTLQSILKDVAVSVERLLELL